MPGFVEGRVVVVTGAGRGLGRSHALALAGEGAAVVVNDVGAALDGSLAADFEAQAVVDEIARGGGRAIANHDDVASWAGAGRLIQAALDTYGRLDALVCNAGTLLDRDLADMSEADWDAVVRVHLNGHAAPLHHAARYWRDRHEATGEPSGGRVVLTTSTAGLWGEAGRANYNSAKAGIVLLGRTAAQELASFGVSVNVIAPYARTRMTVSLEADLAEVPPAEVFDWVDPANISPLVVWLCSEEAAVTGQVFEIHGGYLGLIEAARRGNHIDAGRRWELAELGPAVARLLEERP